MRIVPKNWIDFQHYKDRAPPWIKLHRGLLDNYDFHCLPVASRALAPMLWLLASENERGEIDADPKRVAFRLRMTEADARVALKPLIDNGFFLVVGELEQIASNALADELQFACLETERETEKETEEKSRKRSSAPAALSVSALVSDGLTEQTAEEWLAHRKRKRAPLTARAWEGIKAQATTAGWSIEKAVCKALERGWTAFEAGWIAEGQPGQKNAPITVSSNEADKTAAYLKAQEGRAAKPSAEQLQSMRALRNGGLQ